MEDEAGAGAGAKCLLSRSWPPPPPRPGPEGVVGRGGCGWRSAESGDEEGIEGSGGGFPPGEKFDAADGMDMEEDGLVVYSDGLGLLNGDDAAAADAAAAEGLDELSTAELEESLLKAAPPPPNGCCCCWNVPDWFWRPPPGCGCCCCL